MKRVLMLAFCMLIAPVFGMGKGSMVNMLNRINQSVVNIETTIVHSSCKNVGLSYGTGFLINKEKGIFLTNAHVISSGSVCRYNIQFANGKEAPAKLRYYDPWQDFAFLQVDPADIPDQTDALKLKPNGVAENEEVFIIGNNGGREYSFLSGRIANSFECMGLFPNQSFRITLNNSPGSSGSPVLNMDGEVIGIIHSGNDASSGFALPMQYVVDSLKQVLAGKTPVRKHIGALVDYASLDKMVKFLKLPVDIADKYVKDFPQARRKILKVVKVLKGSPSDGVLEPGDIVVAVNGKTVGPNLYEMDKMFDNSNGPLTIDIYRYGERKTLKVNTYNLQEHKIEQLVIAGGATFYKADDAIRLQTGANPGSIFITNVQRGGSFYYAPIFPIPDTDKLLISVVDINKQPVKTLDDISRIFNGLSTESHLSITYKNFGYYYTYSRTFVFNHGLENSEVTYNPSDMPLMVFEFNEKEMDWIKK
ncbi:MAG: serine protease [Candidatus Paracaedibacteraceae bacterium]|nr:serine protease [Candidatus Paracaedibacteraceae bacterium]